MPVFYTYRAALQEFMHSRKARKKMLNEAAVIG
jgi:hypothetical protein